MWTVDAFFRKRRKIYLMVLGLTVTACVALSSLGICNDRVIQNLSPTLEDVADTILRLRKATFQQTEHQLKQGSAEPALKSPVYSSNKTVFDNSFPPNTKRALTLETAFVIGNFELCSGIGHIAYLVVVHSAVKHLDRRHSIRSTWGRQNLIKGFSSRTIFLVGQIDDKPAQNVLIAENEAYGDIIQGEFMDTHKNMTLKNVMGLRWVSNYCSDAKFVVKTDDDVFVDIFRARQLYFSHLETSPRQIICKVGMQSCIFRIQDWPPGEKSTVSDDYFNGLLYYPMPWCFGFVVFMSMNMYRELYQAALNTPAYPLDDVYVYGILTSTIKGATWRNEEARFSKEEEETMSNWGCNKTQPYIVGTFRSDAAAQKLWNATLTCL